MGLAWGMSWIRNSNNGDRLADKLSLEKSLCQRLSVFIESAVQKSFRSKSCQCQSLRPEKCVSKWKRLESIAQKSCSPEKVREITDGKGVDLAFDAVTGNDLELVAQSVRSEGTILVYGALTPQPTPLPLRLAMVNNLTIRGHTLYSIVVKDPARLERAKKWVYDQLAACTIRPIIAKTFPLTEIVEAHQFMESNEQIGKIVVTVP